ncbi:MAG: hypothetical protein U9Q82_15885, partial [Chloroflexota bacterium]|nr:hypothetical protein [Chloroflexota bacterium]
MIWKLIGSAAIIALMGIAPRPHEIRTGFERVRVAQRFDCPQRAATELAHLAEQLPRRDDLWESAGHHAMAGDSPEDAIEYFETAAANGNLTPDGYLALGDAYHQSGELNAATQTWEAINASHLPSAEILNRLTETYLARDNYAKAIVSLENLLNLQEIIIRGRLPVINSRSSENSVYYVLGLLLAAHNPQSAPVYLLRAAKSD